jgi:outer membrane protein
VFFRAPPGNADAQKQLETLSGTYDADYKKMVEEYQGKLKKRSRVSYCY